MNQPKSPAPLCNHSKTTTSSERLRNVCKALLTCKELYGHDARFEAFFCRFSSQIERGLYTVGFFSGKPSTLRAALDAMYASQSLPTHAWLDTFPMRPKQREILRNDLTESGLLERRFRKAAKMQSVFQEKIVRKQCDHDLNSIVCAKCRAKQNIKTFFRTFPTLAPLQVHYLARVQTGMIELAPLCKGGSALWHVIDRFAKSGTVSHDWFDEQYQTPQVNAVRDSLVACNLLPKRSSSTVTCRNHSLGDFCKRSCAYAKAKRKLVYCFRDRPLLKPLRDQLLLQVDRGIYQIGSFSRRKPFGKALHSLLLLNGLPTPSWLDALPVRFVEREQFRTELITCGLLRPLESFPDQGRCRATVQKLDRRRCEHGAVQACRRCFAGRTLQSAIAPYPLLYTLRDYFLSELEIGYYRPHFFRSNENPLWRYIRHLGAAPQDVCHEWFAVQAKTFPLRHLQKALIACGLLREQVDHFGVGRYDAWATAFISKAQGIDEGDRRIAILFLRLSCLKLARRSLNQREDDGADILSNLRGRVRRAIDLCLFAASKGHTLATLDSVDVTRFNSHALDQMRPFIIWLRRNKYSTMPPTPLYTSVKGAYNCLGTANQRLTIARLLNDEQIPLNLRVCGLLISFGLASRQIVRLRASNVLYCSKLFVGTQTYPLPEQVARMTNTLKQQLLAEARSTRPVGWDPWLFASADALEAPPRRRIADELIALGFRPKAMRNGAIRIAASDPMMSYATGKVLGKSRKNTYAQLKAFSGRASSYAAQLATKPLESWQEI